MARESRLRTGLFVFCIGFPLFMAGLRLFRIDGAARQEAAIARALAADERFAGLRVEREGLGGGFGPPAFSVWGVVGGADAGTLREDLEAAVAGAAPGVSVWLRVQFPGEEAIGERGP